MNSLDFFSPLWGHLKLFTGTAQETLHNRTKLLEGNCRQQLNFTDRNKITCLITCSVQLTEKVINNSGNWYLFWNIPDNNSVSRRSRWWEICIKCIFKLYSNTIINNYKSYIGTFIKLGPSIQFESSHMNSSPGGLKKNSHFLQLTLVEDKQNTEK